MANNVSSYLYFVLQLTIVSSHNDDHQCAINKCTLRRHLRLWGNTTSYSTNIDQYSAVLDKEAVNEEIRRERPQSHLANTFTKNPSNQKICSPFVS